ncbi:HBL/NHE enterotoxin family protein [Streptomyces sp. 1222.5]|uniref:HBL/NHE enterotoxin family protein n=1 Tax=Streptomyces sp. 1222.5 TaxID=1881026 RepID=UPI003D72B97C
MAAEVTALAPDETALGRAIDETQSTDNQSKSALATEAGGTNLRVIQHYALSLERQPSINFGAGGLEILTGLGDTINNHLTGAKKDAGTFLNVTVPKGIKILQGIIDVAATYAAIRDCITPNMTGAEIKELLSIFRSQVQAYHEDAVSFTAELDTARTAFNTASANLAEDVSALDAAVSGSEGILASIDQQIAKLDEEISGAIGGMVASCLGIIGGAIMIAVGAVGSVVTGGAATALIVAGVAVAAAGVGGAAATGTMIAEANKTKAELIVKRETINAQAKAAQVLKVGLSALGAEAGNAADAAQAMANSWSALDGDLEALEKALTDGKTYSSAMMQKIFVSPKVDRMQLSAQKCIDDLTSTGPVDPNKPVEQVQRELLANAEKKNQALGVVG